MKTARQWSKEFNFPCTAEMINCTGCQAAGAKVGRCSECELRACGSLKKVANCGVCPDYASCPKIAGFIKLAPSVKATLDGCRAARG